MKGKKTPRKSRDTEQIRQKAREEQPRTQPAEEENPMDFGGLPQRDLKKNLGGCG